MTARFAIDRVVVTLAGIAPAEAERTARALHGALIERLGGWRPDVAGAAPLNLGVLDLGSIGLAARLDAATLAAVVGDRMMASIDAAITRSQEKVR
jgi:hypothetical protein